MANGIVHNMKKPVFITVACFAILIFSRPAYAQAPPQSQTGGGIVKTEEDIEKARALEKKIKQEKPAKEEAGPTTEKPLEEGAKTLVKNIDVRGATLVSKKYIDPIVSQYKDKELGVKEMQKLCDLITDEYRKAGYVTSRAYLPPQTIRDGQLVVMVIEGRLGNVEVKNNRYFNGKILKKKLKLKPGAAFDYKTLQRSLTRINEHPDRFVKAVLVPGHAPGDTDIALDVKDNLPIHIGYEFDNFGSRYINYDRHSVTAEHNNLLGLDDKLFFKYQKGENVFYDFYNFRYTISLADRLDGGVYWLWSDVKLGKEFKAQDIRGYSKLGGAFLNYSIIDLPTVDLRFNLGFDYKHIANYTGGNKTSRDESRVIKPGFDLDVYDRWGRTILSIEEDLGIPFGDLHAKDPLATKEGAGSEFNKLAGSLYRLQPMPFSSSILWKNQFQATHYRMLAVEQFQVGGISNVRGYAPAEFTGDAGYATSVEWSFPIYPLPKDIKVPLSKSTFYDATRLVAFYDLGYVHTNLPRGVEQEDRTVQGWGGGVRFNLPENFYSRFEFAYRFASKARFNDANLYIDVSKKF